MLELVPPELLWLVAIAFIAGLVDAAVGGGGLVQLPGLFTVLPQHTPAMLFGTNKFSSMFGTGAAAWRYARNVRFPWRPVLFAAGTAFVFSFAGATAVSLLPKDAVRPLVLVLLFVLIAIFAFRLDIFTADIWGVKNPDLGSVMNQVRNMMLVTVWVFIGIEGASIFSSRAEKRSDVGKATVIGFITVLLFLVLVNVLSLGIMTQPELAKLQNPSMAAVLEHVVGHWGAVLISVGLIISLLGALLSWVLLCAEIMFAAAKDHTMPEFLRKENANHVPVNALWLTNAMVQLFLIITLFSASTYLSLIYLATSMILVPYLWSAAYAVLLAVRGESYEQALAERKKDLFIGAIALIYAIWLLYAGGVKYLLLSALLYAPGAILFAKAKLELGKPIFTNVEKLIFAAVVLGALVAAYGLYDGFLTL